MLLEVQQELTSGGQRHSSLHCFDLERRFIAFSADAEPISCLIEFGRQRLNRFFITHNRLEIPSFRAVDAELPGLQQILGGGIFPNLKEMYKMVYIVLEMNFLIFM